MDQTLEATTTVIGYIKDWQTLIAGLAATLAAIWTISVMRRSMREETARHNKRLEKQDSYELLSAIWSWYHHVHGLKDRIMIIRSTYPFDEGIHRGVAPYFERARDFSSGIVRHSEDPLEQIKLRRMGLDLDYLVEAAENAFAQSESCRILANRAMDLALVNDGGGGIEPDKGSIYYIRYEEALPHFTEAFEVLDGAVRRTRTEISQLKSAVIDQQVSA